jgi:hypothetical protein
LSEGKTAIIFAMSKGTNVLHTDKKELNQTKNNNNNKKLQL